MESSSNFVEETSRVHLIQPSQMQEELYNNISNQKCGEIRAQSHHLTLGATIIDLMMRVAF